MPTAFKNHLTSNIGVAPTVVFTTSAVQTTVYSLTVANILAPSAPITVSVFITSGATTAFLVKNVPIPETSTLVVIGEPQKLAMESGDTISVVASNAVAADVVISIVELT